MVVFHYTTELHELAVTLKRVIRFSSWSSVECKITNVDRKNRNINLSIKAKDVDDEKTAMKEVRQREVETAGPTTIGELIKAQMANKE